MLFQRQRSFFSQDNLDGISNLYGFNCINYINALSRLSGAREFKGCYDSYLHYLVLKHFNPINDPCFKRL
ncbi:hypothetical protein ID1079_12540 [Helicobacter pylori]